MITRGLRRGWSVALVAILLSCLLCTAAAARPVRPGAARARPARLGAAPAVHRLAAISPSFLPPTSEPTARSQALARIRALGVTVARIDANWTQIERRPGSYNWSPLDREIGELVAHRLSPMIILGYGNPLYSAKGALAQRAGFTGAPPFGLGSPSYYPPDSPAPFARFAAALARRYRNQVHLLEVWNEENLGWRFWEPHEDPVAYAALLKATYRAVKSVVPRDHVAFGGTFYPAIDTTSAAANGIPVPSGTAADELAFPHQGTLDFVAHALAAAPDLGRYFDAMAYHPYHFPYMAPEVNIPIEGTTETSMVALRGLLARHGMRRKPIWISEVGWPNNTGAYGPSPAKSASYLVRTFTTAWAHGIQDVVWYCYGDGSDWQYNQESAFGIVDSAGKPKPAYYAWKALNRLLLTLPYLGSAASSLRLPGDGHALRFGDRRRQATVVWLAPETMLSDQGPGAAADQRATVRTPAGTTAILDMTGRRLPLRRTFEASPYPVYLVRTTTGR